ncbi:MAG: hypothetical protein HY904_06815 [Deltaproteobacteria bacterium]|nr:hypothetical protein [Deltaproteobacteria bacterium]
MAGYEVKGFHFRGILAALESEGLTAEVRDRLAPGEAAFMERPPLPGAWVEGRVMDAISEAVLALRGPQVLRRVHKLAVNRGAMTVLRPVVESVMRVLGVSPGTLLAQLNTLQGAAARGIEHRFEARGPAEGVLATSVVGNVPDSFFEGTAGSMEALCTLCGVTPLISAPEVTRTADRTTGRLQLSWRR